MFSVGGRPLRVLFLGNDDNVNYQMAKWSREFGVDADLWLIQPTDPYRGHIRLLEPDMGEFPKWIKNVPLGDGRRVAFLPGKIGREIEAKYDFIGVAGPASLMASLRLRKPRALHCIGAEIGDLPFPFKADYAVSQGHRSWRYNVSVALLIRAALRRLDFIVDSFNAQIPIIKRLGLQSKLRLMGFPADCGGSRGRVRPQLRIELMQRYGHAKRVYMWFSRLNFSDPQSLIYKGAERFLQALECVLPELQRGAIRLVVGRHGNELKKFLELVDSSPVKEFIDWVPHLGADELSTYLSLPSAVLFAEFSEHLQELSGIGRDAAAIGTVTVSSGRAHVIAGQYGRAAPILHAVKTEEIADRMRELAEMPEQQFIKLQREMSDFGTRVVDYHTYIPKFYACVQEAMAAHN